MQPKKTSEEPVPLKVHSAAAGAAPTPREGLADLLQYEAGLRRQPELAALLYFIANESSRIVEYDQMFVLRRTRVGSGFEVVAVSSIAAVDRNAPLIQAVEREINSRLAGDKAVEASAFDVLSADDAEADWEEDILDYPFNQWLWQPLLDDEGFCFGGLLLARARAFSDPDRLRVERIAETASHAWRALTGNRPVRQIRKPTRREKQAMLILAGAILLFPVQMSARAPMEVVAGRPYTLAAPVNGIISKIHVVPNAVVAKGQLLVSFDDLKLRNELQVAADQVAIARARAERANSEAFDDSSRAREIAITLAELELAEADYEYAREMFNRRQIVAPRAGMAIYSDRRDWEGRAVQIGDPILQLADPKDVMFRIDLPAREQMALAPGNRVEVFLDAQPLWSIDGTLETGSYQARMTPENVMAFALTARPVGALPRIGSRGTARVYGRWVPFGYSLFRRPIASLRQYLGY